MGDRAPPLIGNPYNGYINPYYYWVDEFIPYYIGNVMGVDRPDRTCNVSLVVTIRRGEHPKYITSPTYDLCYRPCFLDVFAEVV